MSIAVSELMAEKTIRVQRESKRQPEPISERYIRVGHQRGITESRDTSAYGDLANLGKCYGGTGAKYSSDKEFPHSTSVYTAVLAAKVSC